MGGHAHTGSGNQEFDMINPGRSQLRSEQSLATTASTNGTFDIVGQYEAFIVVTHVDAGVAAATLPREFELVPPPGTPKGMHPVMYSFGKHRHVHPDGIKVYEYDYDEALVGLPHVAIRGTGKGSSECFHMTDVRLNNKLATDIGRVLGFPKHMATITNTDVAYEIRDRSETLLTATVHLDGRQFKADHPHFELISKMMQQPVLSKSAGKIITTHFAFNTAQAFMVPARMKIEVTSDLLACLPRGTYVFDTIDNAQFGGAYMSIHSWRISQRPLIIV
jgi:hypothetical protein